MASRFQPENFQPEDAPPYGIMSHAPVPGERRLIDPEQYDASEQQFAASLGAPSGIQSDSQLESQFESGHAPYHEPGGPPAHVAPRARFVAAETEATEVRPAEISGAAEAEPNAIVRTEPPANGSAQHRRENAAAAENSASSPQDSRAWRNEVSARVNSYRNRRPRAPRYPSLQLKFESSEPRWNNYRATETSPPTVRPANVSAPPVSELQPSQHQPEPPPQAAAEPASPQPLHPEQPCSPPPASQISSSISYAPETNNLLEFPRSMMMPPPRPANELAEPVQDRLRIIEAPEITPPPPALGGILIETQEEPVTERRPGFEIPLQSSARSRRVYAAAIDAVIVLAAVALFGYIFVKIAAPVLQWRELATVTCGISALLWASYQFLALVYTGSTPGLRLAKLRLARFDGTSVPRRLRRWRALASLLSAVSLALGYLWCFLDEDHLCWHDRITRTHMAPRNQQ